MKKESDKVWVTISETVNLGNYESVKVEAGYSKSYTTEKPEELINKGIDELRLLVEGKAKKTRKKRRK